MLLRLPCPLHRHRDGSRLPAHELVRVHIRPSRGSAAASAVGEVRRRPGRLHGGNDVDYEPPDMPAGKAAIDEMNTRMSGCQPFWRTHGGLWCLRAPLFRITARSDETSDELVATSYRRLVHKKKDGFEEWADELGGMPWQEGCRNVIPINYSC